MELELFKSQQTSFIDRLPPDLNRALELYTTSKYQKINNVLEGIEESTDEIRDIVKKLDTVFSMAPQTTTPLTIYRGMKLDAVKTPRRYKTESVMMNYKGKYEGFISCSLSYDVADNFTKGTCCVLEISVPIGSKLIYLEPLTTANGEYEVLIQRGSVLEIYGFGYHDGARIILSKITDPTEESPKEKQKSSLVKKFINKLKSKH